MDGNLKQFSAGIKWQTKALKKKVERKTLEVGWTLWEADVLNLLPKTEFDSG